jgi:hypothetical protein
VVMKKIPNSDVNLHPGHPAYSLITVMTDLFELQAYEYN